MGEMNDSSENESNQGGRESVSQNSVHENDLETEQGNKDFQRQMSMSPDSVVFQQPQTLEQEFELMNTNIPNIQVEEVSYEHCGKKLHGNMNVHIQFVEVIYEY